MKVEGRRALAARIAAADRVFWFIDFDGTLVPIVRRPDLVAFPERGRRALAALAERADSTVTVVSGRPLSFLREKVGLKGITYAGNHGLEIRGRGVRFLHRGAKQARPALRRIKKAWGECAALHRGALVEDKGYTLSFHYRQVSPSSQEDARLCARRLAGEACRRGELRLTAGKKVVEVRPAVPWGKGDALDFLLRERGYRPRRDFVVAAGDDETDRDMFRRLPPGGAAIFVGGGTPPTEAGLHLSGPAAMGALLERFAER